MLSAGSSTHEGAGARTPQIDAADPSGVLLVKSLLHPVAAVAALMGCLLAWRVPFSGPYLLVAVLAFIGVSEFLEITKPDGRQPPLLRWFFDIAVRWAVVVGFIWGLLHLCALGGLFDSRALATWALTTPLVLWGGQVATHHYLLRKSLRRKSSRRSVIVGMTDLGCLLEDRLCADPMHDMEVVGYFEDRGIERLPAARARRVLGKTADLSGFVLRNRVNTVYIMLPITRHPRILELLESLRDSTVSIYFVPDVFVFNLVQARFDLVSGIPVVAVCESPFYGFRGVAKRCCDIVCAAGLLIGLSPVLLAVAVGVRLSSPGPVVFKQKRYGLDGKEILIYKFRSMCVTEDGEKVYTQVTREDPRVTRFGHFIRKTSLDELPQLVNVLQGRISLVGPRPHAVAVNEQYRRLIPSYMVRHKVKPGITGWAQVNGYRGGDDLESMKQRIEFDLQYLRHWSLQLDLAILARTVTLVWRDSRAY